MANKFNQKTEPVANVKPAEVKTVKKVVFPCMYIGPTIKDTGLIYGQVYSGPEYPQFVKELLAKAPILASLIKPVTADKKVPDAVIKTFLTQLKGE